MKNPSAIFRIAAVIFISMMLLSGCHHPGSDLPEAHPEPWTPSEIENMLGGDDPMEGFNRSMFSCTDFLMKYVADPLGRVYTTVFPRFFIEHLHNVCVNLEYPDRVVSSLLQAEWGAAGDETVRFFTNTTIGIAGIFDVAGAWFGIPSSEADMGQAFARWGIGPGESFMLPVVPAINGRDMIGMLFDAALDMKTYIPYAGSATALNRMVMMQGAYEQAVGKSLDPYKDYRQLMLLRRELQTRMWFYRAAKESIAELKKNLPDNIDIFNCAIGAVAAGELNLKTPKPQELKGRWLDLPAYRSQGSITDSMRTLMLESENSYDKWYMPLSWLNSEFAKQGSIRKVALKPDRPELYYSFWDAPETAEDAENPETQRLLFILPGIGGACNTDVLEAFAERFHHAGFQVVGLDSTFHWRFISADSRCRLPGYLPEDAERIRCAITAVMDDLKFDGKIGNPEIYLAGYSLGGLQTLKIADLEARDRKIGIKRYIAINPPVSVANALDTIDKLAASSAGWSKSEMKERLIKTAGAQFVLMTRRFPHFRPEAAHIVPAYYQMMIDPDTAKCLVGLYLKLSMRELIFAAHRETPLPGLPEYKWGSRNALYRKIDKISLRDYASGLLAVNYDGVPLETLFKNSTLQSIEETLKNSPDIRVIHSYDDILISDAERRWLDNILGERMLWLSKGGHLGNLYYKSVLTAITDAAE